MTFEPDRALSDRPYRTSQTPNPQSPAHHAYKDTGCSWHKPISAYRGWLSFDDTLGPLPIFHPEVRSPLDSIARFWPSIGVAGFRRPGCFLSTVFRAFHAPGA